MNDKILVPSDQSSESGSVPALAKQIKGNIAKKVQNRATTEVRKLGPKRGNPWPILRYFVIPLS